MTSDFVRRQYSRVRESLGRMKWIRLRLLIMALMLGYFMLARKAEKTCDQRTVASFRTGLHLIFISAQAECGMQAFISVAFALEQYYRKAAYAQVVKLVAYSLGYAAYGVLITCGHRWRHDVPLAYLAAGLPAEIIQFYIN
ncbi:hypothetical protein V1517DRAFT_321912 [Lipomyces orientalis]|uniref:Uncharacterized protein n=1 Tax=Lipomyces orientalis TaxID=1233043 RepID=A0ACC3TNX7_9ASCO